MIYSTIAQVSLVTLLCVTVFAAMVEDRVVRLSALLHALNWVLVAALQRRHEHHVFQTADFLIDTVGAVLACVIAARAEKAWAGALATETPSPGRVPPRRQGLRGAAKATILAALQTADSTVTTEPISLQLPAGRRLSLDNPRLRELFIRRVSTGTLHHG